MTSKTRRTEIQIETHEVKVVRLQRRPPLALCGRCGEIVTALTPEQTAEVLEITLEDVVHLMESGTIHLTDSGRGVAIVCGNSLSGENGIVTRKALSSSL